MNKRRYEFLLSYRKTFPSLAKGSFYDGTKESFARQRGVAGSVVCYAVSITAAKLMLVMSKRLLMMMSCLFYQKLTITVSIRRQLPQRNQNHSSIFLFLVFKIFFCQPRSSHLRSQINT